MRHRVLILGIDGYIGWPLALDLLKNGHRVSGLDNYCRRKRAKSVTKIGSKDSRFTYLKNTENFDEYAEVDMTNINQLSQVLKVCNPDTIIHLAEQPSAPWSMIDSFHSIKTQSDNVIGTLNLLWAIRENCPDAHLIKLGTMGEYGTPDCDIPEGTIPDKPCELSRATIPYEKYKCPMSGLQFPRSPGSFYHLSKVHDTHNIIFACNTWGIRSTDIMQGVVFGLVDTDEKLITRFDYDEYFGTVINRFCAQAIVGHPLTIYGNGNQLRGFLSLSDSIQCIKIAIKNRPGYGEYRVWNQFESIYELRELANIVLHESKKLKLSTKIEHIQPNPRCESEDHYYNARTDKLLNLGYRPTIDIHKEINKTLNTLLSYKKRVNKSLIMPTTRWK